MFGEILRHASKINALNYRTILSHIVGHTVNNVICALFSNRIISKPDIPRSVRDFAAVKFSIREMGSVLSKKALHAFSNDLNSSKYQRHEIPVFALPHYISRVLARRSTRICPSLTSVLISLSIYLENHKYDSASGKRPCDYSSVDL